MSKELEVTLVEDPLVRIANLTHQMQYLRAALDHRMDYGSSFDYPVNAVEFIQTLQQFFGPVMDLLIELGNAVYVEENVVLS